MKDTVLFPLCAKIAEISHVKTLRIHSRIPVVLPERIDENFVKELIEIPLQTVIVLHVNHPNELDERVLGACKLILQAGSKLLNQSVLLGKVNDDVEILQALSEKLFSYGVLPYYLHLLDKVRGAAHFDIPVERALQIFKQLQTLLPGYLVPRLVREEAGMHNKTLVFA